MEKGVWIKNDGANCPVGARVRIRHDREYDPSNWESKHYLLRCGWGGWEPEDGNERPLISHFMIQPD